MTGLLLHTVLFLLLSVPIVVLAAFYGEPDDAVALRSLPRRYSIFVGACVVVALVMIALGSIFASVS